MNVVRFHMRFEVKKASRTKTGKNAWNPIGALRRKRVPNYLFHKEPAILGHYLYNIKPAIDISEFLLLKVVLCGANDLSAF